MEVLVGAPDIQVSGSFLYISTIWLSRLPVPRTGGSEKLPVIPQSCRSCGSGPAVISNTDGEPLISNIATEPRPQAHTVDRGLRSLLHYGSRNHQSNDEAVITNIHHIT